MQIWNALKSIKSISKLRALQFILESQHQKAAGPRSCAVDLAFQHAAANFKAGGAAFFRELCLSHANGIIHCASVSSHSIPPSDETLAWGGFMGGEILVVTDADQEERAQSEVLNIILQHA